VAAWRIGDRFVENAEEATKMVRKLVVEELLSEKKLDAQTDFGDNEEIGQFVADNFDIIEARVKAAMAGA
jgi:hypothetical protein